MKVTLHGLAWGWTRRKDIKKKQTHDTTNTLTLPIWFKTVSVTLTTSNWAILQLNNTVCFNRHSKLVISTVFIDFHAKQKLVPKTQRAIWFVRPCYWHSPSRQRLLYFLYALTASSLRTNTTSATPTFTSRARFKAPHTQNSSCGQIHREYPKHTEWVIKAQLQHSAHNRISNVAKCHWKSVRFTHNYVFLSDPGMQVVHRYFCPLQRTESRLERNMTSPHDQTYAMKMADIKRCGGKVNMPNIYVFR